jgi:hypothetical protein
MVGCMAKRKQKKPRSPLEAWVFVQRAKSVDSVKHDMPSGWKFSLAAFAIAVGVSRQMVRQWLIGASKPDGPHRRAIELATRGAVPARCW